MRLFFAGISHETNSFSPVPADLDTFTRAAWLPEEDPERELLLSTDVVGEVYRLIVERGHEARLGPFFSAEPSAPISASDYEELRERFLAYLTRQATDVDAVFLFLHGAQFAVGIDDCEGDILARVREIIGPTKPVFALLDLHGNIGTKMLQEADGLIACKEYPHTDFIPRAQELIGLLERAVENNTRFAINCTYIPMLTAFHTNIAPVREFMEHVKCLEKGQILSISIFHGFPWADLPEAGANVVVITEDQHSKEGKRLADELAQELWSIRSNGLPDHVDASDAISETISSQLTPVIIADVADNPGGGAPGDSTFILHEAIQRNLGNCVFASVYDPESVRLCEAAGERSNLELSIGGKISPMSGYPLNLNVFIQKILPGKKQTWIWLKHGSIDIIISDQRSQILSPDLFNCIGIDLSSMRAIIIKSSQHFRAHFSGISEHVIYCMTPGALSFEFDKFEYKRLRRPIWPLDDFEWKAHENDN